MTHVLQGYKAQQRNVQSYKKSPIVRFDSFISSGFSAMVVINPPERKLVKRTSGRQAVISIQNLIVFALIEIAHRRTYKQ